MYTLSLILAGLLFTTLQIVVSCHILLFKYDVKSAIGWIGLVWFTPVLGTIVYIVFGINRIKRKAMRLRKAHAIGDGTYKEPAKLAAVGLPPQFAQLWQLGYRVHPQNFCFGNAITPLFDGDEAYPQMCEAISNAKKEVLLASYIFNNDAAGRRFCSALKTAVSNGAKVKVILDGVGRRRGPKPNIENELKNIEGLQYAVFLPVRAALPFVNLRNHRKILVVDGNISFFGGMNIAQDNLLLMRPKEPVRDITFKIEGPVIEQISRLFADDWAFCAKKHFVPLAALRTPAQKGHTPARIVFDGPDNNEDKIEFINLAAINCAQHYITIVTPYFLPQNNILSALQTASMRGVNVNIILPAKSNIPGMDYATAANFANLIKYGVNIYLSPAPFDHSKFVIADDVWVFAGSSNWDERSFKLNFESNIEIANRELCLQLRQNAAAKMAGAKLLKPKNIPLLKRLRNNALRLLTPYY